MDTRIAEVDTLPSMIRGIVDEIEILDALIEKDENVFENVFHLYSGACLNLVRKILRNEAKANDVVQNVFIALFEKPERFDPTRGSIRTFLLTQCRSRSIDLIRSETARAKREQKSGEQSVDDYSHARVANTESIVLQWSLSDQVKQALENLSTDEKNAIVLSYYQGLTYREVASELQLPEGTVKSRIRSALKKLKVHLSFVEEGAVNEKF